MGADITLPWFAWVAIASGLTTAVAWLAKTWKASIESTHTEVIELTREVTIAMVHNNEVIREHALLLRELMDLVRERQ